MYPLPFPSFPNLLGNSFSFLFFHSTSPNSITWVHLSVLCKSERLRLNPFEYLVQLVSGGADRKDEFFHFNVPPFCTQSRGIKATFLHGALIYFRPLHNAALAVKCMNKEREWLSLSHSLSLMRYREARYVSKIMDTSRGDQRRSFCHFDDVRSGFIWSRGLPKSPAYLSLARKENKKLTVLNHVISGALDLISCLGVLIDRQGYGQCLGGMQT